MDINELIDSGNLEAYLLGELSIEENEFIELMKKKHPELKQELDKIENSMKYMAKKTAIKPRSNLKNELLEKIEDRNTRNIQFSPDSKNTNYKLVASISMTIVSSLLAIFFYSKNRDLINELSHLKKEFIITQNQKSNLENDLNANKKLASLATQPSFNKIVLASTKESMDSNGIIYWDDKNGELYFIMNITNAISENEDFQLWAIIDGQPIDAGILNLNPQAIQEMNKISSASAFAVTVEPKGGSKNPTLDKMIMAGSVSL